MDAWGSIKRAVLLFDCTGQCDFCDRKAWAMGLGEDGYYHDYCKEHWEERNKMPNKEVEQPNTEQDLAEVREEIASEMWCCSINLEMERRGEPIRYLPEEFKEQRLIDKTPYYETVDQILKIKVRGKSIGDILKEMPVER